MFREIEEIYEDFIFKNHTNTHTHGYKLSQLQIPAVIDDPFRVNWLKGFLLNSLIHQNGKIMTLMRVMKYSGGT